MVNKEQNVQESDTTKVEISNKVDNINILAVSGKSKKPRGN